MISIVGSVPNAVNGPAPEAFYPRVLGSRISVVGIQHVLAILILTPWILVPWRPLRTTLCLIMTVD